jgi:hypothetical protein
MSGRGRWSSPALSSGGRALEVSEFLWFRCKDWGNTPSVGDARRLSGDWTAPHWHSFSLSAVPFTRVRACYAAGA